MLGDFFEGSVAGLDIEEVYDSQFDAEPDAVNDVVFPVDVLEGDGIDLDFMVSGSSLGGGSNRDRGVDLRIG
jgi:hypothetical protein